MGERVAFTHAATVIVVIVVFVVLVVVIVFLFVLRIVPPNIVELLIDNAFPG